MRRIKHIPLGTTFGHLTTISHAFVPPQDRQANVLCRCNLCEGEGLMRCSNLRNGRSTKCKDCRTINGFGNQAIGIRLGDGREFRSINAAAKALDIDKNAIFDALKKTDSRLSSGMVVKRLDRIIESASTQAGVGFG